MRHFKTGIVLLVMALLLVGFLVLKPRSTNAATAFSWKKIRTYVVDMNIAGNNKYTIGFYFETGENEWVDIKSLDVLNTFLVLLNRKDVTCEWASESKILHVTGLYAGGN